MIRPHKLDAPLILVKKYFEKGLYRFVRHAWHRLQEREVSIFEVLQMDSVSL